MQQIKVTREMVRALKPILSGRPMHRIEMAQDKYYQGHMAMVADGRWVSWVTFTGFHGISPVTKTPLSAQAALTAVNQRLYEKQYRSHDAYAPVDGQSGEISVAAFNMTMRLMKDMAAL